MSFTKHDAGKPRFDLIDPAFDLERAEVLTDGAASYGDDNWKSAAPAEARRRYQAALDRHFNAWKRGETHDPQSGRPHLAHVAINAEFLRHFERQVE
jgi:hypothetical protein